MTNDVSKTLNTIALLVLAIPLLIDFAIQLTTGPLPCPLCLLQRIAVAGVAVGLILNLACGIRPSHYAVMILSAVLGGSVALGQITLHIVPGTGTYGPPLFGFHLYTWAFGVFGAIVILSAAMLLFDQQYKADDDLDPQRMSGLAKIACTLIVLITLGNVASTFLECGLAECPANPETYIMLQ